MRMLKVKFLLLLVLMVAMGPVSVVAAPVNVYWTARSAATLNKTNVGSGTTTQLTLTNGRLQDVDLDMSTNTLYFADWGNLGGMSGAINRIQTDGSGLGLVLGGGVIGDAVHQLALDQVNNRIYFTRAVAYDDREISRVDTSGANYTQLHTGIAPDANGWFYSGLAVDIPNNALYWGDIGVVTPNPPADGAVNTMTLAGAGLTTLVPHVDGKGRGFALDQASQMLFYTAHEPHSPNTGGALYSYDIVNGIETPLISDPCTGYWDIEIDPSTNRIWWTDNGRGQIWSANFDGSNPVVELTGLTDVYGLALEVPEEVVKWEQPPCLDDPNCMDVDATDDNDVWYASQALADDFLCTTTGLITDIHIWGSWLWDDAPDYDPNHVWFTLCLYSNDPCGPMGWSEPNELLWTKEFHEGDFDVEIYAEGLEAYYIPCEPFYISDADFTCWLYSFYIDPCEAFVQEEGTIYWLALQAHIYEPDMMEAWRFGWKNSSEQWNDDAVWTVGELPDNLGPWQELLHPMTLESVDLAFKITTVEEEEVPAKPAVPHLKWSQPPIEKSQQPTELLYGSSPWAGSMSLSTVNPDTGLVTIIGPFLAPWSITEIEWSPDGSTLYATTGGGTSTIHTIDPTTGVVLSTVLQIPAGGALQGLEFNASGTLLGTHVPMGGMPSDLVTVNTVTGVLTTIGPTGFGPIGGLAFDSGFNTLYGITSGLTVPPILLSVNPSTGAAAQIAVTTMNAEASSLEFTADGRLVTAGNDGNFYEINPTTGVATFIGPLVNEPKLSGLSLRPTPPIYWGWDETSYNQDYNEPSFGPWPYWKIVADDFRCLGSMPVASIHWWGSHYGWEDPNKLPAASDLPDAWQISFWSNSLCSGIGGKTDVLFLTDTTGSMVGYINDFKTALSGILTAIGTTLPGADIKYAVADYRNYTDGGNYQTYGVNLIQPFTSDTIAVNNAINGLTASGGADTAESHLKGMVNIANNWLTAVGDLGFDGRADAQKILIWAGDAHGHIAGDEPGASGPPPAGYYPTLNATINALTAQGILVFALNTVDCSGGINMPYGGIYGQTALKQQADEITSATSGTLFCSVGTGGPSIEDAIVGSITGAVGYSCPEQLLWQIEVDANRVDVDQVGTDEFCTVYPNDVAYQYYLDLEPNEYFWQKDFEPNTIDDIFWLSIVAVYPDTCEPGEPVNYPWGWKTRPWSWMDDAVTFGLDSEPVLGPRMERVVDYTREAGDPPTSWGGFRALYIWNGIMYIGDIGMDLFGHYDGTTFTYDADLGGSCIYDFEVYDSNLYACAYVGNIHRSSDGTTWTTIRGDQPDHSWELEAFQGYLYVSTGPNLERYDGATFTLVWTEPSGYEIISMLNDGSDLIIGVGNEAGYGGSGGVGKVYSYDGIAVNLISGNMGDGIQALLESGGTLYAGGSNPGVVYEYLGGGLWQTISPTLGTAVLSLCEFEGDLYAGTMNGGRVWRYDGGISWTQIGGEIDDQVCSLIVYNGSLYAGTAWRGGRLYRYNTDAVWVLDPNSITPIKDPVYHESFDVAFELDTDPNYIKWEQPFTGIRDWPHYEDELSMAFATGGGETATKYVQQPDLDPTGMDVLAGPLSVDPCVGNAYEKFLADDFNCTSSGPITDIHIWASYNEDIRLTDVPWFSLVIYENVPAGTGGIPYSRPGAVLWDAYLQPTVEWIYATAEESFYDPNPDQIIGFDSTVWRFDFDIDPDEAFVQEEGKIYWLGVHHSFDLNGDGIVNIMDFILLRNVWPGVFGWKTSLEHFEDNAVWTDVLTFMDDPHVVPSGEIWNELRYPIGHSFEGQSIDLAFEITTQESESEPNILRLVADDWRCDGNTPVTALAWWGSYIGYAYNVGHIEEIPPPMPLPVKPDYFRLNIWTDVPAGADPDPCYPYSHPNDIIWEYDAYDYDEVLVGYDKHPEGAPNEPVFRYSVRLPEADWFLQDDVNNNVYWLSVVAVYDQDAPNYDWGWTNHKHMFNDDAVEGYFDPPAGWFWSELYDQTGETEDMSFVLFTEPDCMNRTNPDYADWVAWGKPDCWCYSRNCRGDADGIKVGAIWVMSGDITILRNAAYKDDATLATVPNGICADFDRIKVGAIRVMSGDIAILRTYAYQAVVPECGTPPDPNYNFWTTP